MEKDFMLEAIKESNINSLNNYKDGGPFGAVIVKDGKIIGRGHNTVLSSNDPTAHAEVNAIRDASKKLNTYDLKECILYTSSEPCPMCLSAIIWANIKEVYYANTKEETAKIGFRDDMIYDFIKSNNTDERILKLKHMEETTAIETFNDFEKTKEKIVY